MEIANDRQVKATTGIEGRTVWYTIQGAPGLRLRIRLGADGKPVRSFFYRYKAPDGRQKLKALGQYPDVGLASAREHWSELRTTRKKVGALKEHLAKVRADKVAELAAAQKQTERDRDTFSQLVTDFISHQAKQIRSWKEQERVLRTYTADIAGRPLHSIRRKDITELMDQLDKAGHQVQANRLRVHLRTCFGWAMQRERIEHNPCEGIKARKEPKRDRWLNDTELRRLFANMPSSSLSGAHRDLLNLLVLTGARLSEVAHARFAEFDIAGRVWRLPAARSKNTKPKTLPLCDQVLAIIEKRCGPSAFLFPLGDKFDPNADRAMRHDSIHTPLRDAMSTLNLEPFTPHDLRRTCATGLSTLGAPREVVMAILHHTDSSVTARYDRNDRQDEMRHWLQLWADHIDALRPPNTGQPAEEPK